MGFAQRCLGLVVDELCDPAHGCHRDLSLSLKRSGLWGHVLLKLAEWNIPHGPWNEAARSQEVRAAYRSYFERYRRPQDSPLFMELLPWMAWEQGEQHLVGDPELAERYWARCQENNPFMVKGAKTNLNRFLSYLGKGQQEMELHSVRLLGYLCTALEQDYVGNSKLTKLICKGASKKEGGDTGATGGHRTGEVELAAAKAAVNQLAIGCMVLLDRQAQRRERGMQLIGHSLTSWCGRMSRLTRDVVQSRSWLMGQLRGDYFAHLTDMLPVLQTPASLSSIGFQLPRPSLKLEGDPLMDAQMSDDDLAAELAKFSLNLVGCRLARSSWMLAGFSARSLLWCHEALAGQFVWGDE
jgi:hypothetical protein